MKRYISPEMTFETFETTDVIAASNLQLALQTNAPADNEKMTITYEDLWKQ